MHKVGHIRQKYEALKPFMDGRMRRLWAAAEAEGLGRGGISAVAAATGLSRTTMTAGIAENQQRQSDPAAAARLRRAGAGRKSLTAVAPTLWRDLESLVDPVTRGGPPSPLRWTGKSTSTLAAELQAMGHQIGERTVAHLLPELDDSLQANRKTNEGSAHPDRAAQFQYLNQRITAFQPRGQPVVSVDAKKKGLVGDFKPGGRDWRPNGQPERVRVHDLEDNHLGKAIPDGLYDVAANTGWVSVGTDHDTAAVAVETLRRWWYQMGRRAYPRARQLLVMADGGGSNGWRTRLWKLALQRLADGLGLRIAVSHLPPGTSKWNKTGHRLVAHITQNWRGQPLVSHEVIVRLIGHTKTKPGLQVRADLNTGT